MSTEKHPAAKKTYSDGHPLDSVHYREYKILLKPDHFTTAHHFKDFAKLLRHAAEQNEVPLFSDKVLSEQNQTREVVFYDTHKFDLYNNAFILRRRTLYENGFASGEPELALKFRHVDRDTAAAIDVRPDEGKHRIKFKEELLPLPDKLGGIRSLYSHNVVLAMSTPAMDPSVKHVTATFPTLHQIELSGRKVALVNDICVEEVLHDLGELHFGHGVEAKANVAVWRQRKDERPLVGEFAFQCKFTRDDEQHAKANKRAEKFFIAVQLAVHDWVQLGTTKTRIVYGLGSTEVHNRE